MVCTTLVFPLEVINFVETASVIANVPAFVFVVVKASQSKPKSVEAVRATVTLTEYVCPKVYPAAGIVVEIVTLPVPEFVV